MKKLVCLMISLMMLMVSGMGLGESSYTLPEKMNRQLTIGSGLKGSFTMHLEGTDPLILSLMPFQDVELQVRSLRSGVGGDGLYEIYQENTDGSKNGLTEAYQQGESWFFRSDLLPDQVIMLPPMTAVADWLHAPEGGNPSFASALVRWSQLPEAKRQALLTPVTDKMTQALETWLAGFAGVSEVRTLENGTSAVDLTYTIPMAEIRKELVLLLRQMLQDPDGTALVQSVLTEAQQERYANANLDYFYEQALDSLQNDYDITYTRTISTLGQPISSSLDLPLDEKSTGYQFLSTEEHGGLQTFTLRGEDQYLTLMLPEKTDLSEIDSFNCWLYSRTNGDEEQEAVSHALRISVSHSSELSSDEESRDHLRESWSVQAVRDLTHLPEGEEATAYPEETPWTAELQLHYFSRYSQSSPTTLELEALLEKEHFALSLRGSFKTASPWAFSPFDVTGAKDLTEMTDTERTLLLAEWLTAAGEQLTHGGEQPEAADSEADVGLSQAAEPAENDGKTETAPAEAEDTDEVPDHVPEADDATDAA